MKTKYIILDMDGLMIDSEKLAYGILKSIVQQRGFGLSCESFRQLVGTSQQHSEQYFTEHYPGLDGKRDVYDVFFPKYFEALKNGDLETKPGLFPLFEELDNRGIKRAVASSNKLAVVKASLEYLGLCGRIDAVVGAEMVDRAKPFPDLFLKAAALLEAEPQECLVLEDSRSGVFAAVAAGIPVVLIPDLVAPSEDMLAAVLHKFDSLYDVIDFIRANDIRGEITE